MMIGKDVEFNRESVSRIDAMSTTYGNGPGITNFFSVYTYGDSTPENIVNILVELKEAFENVASKYPDVVNYVDGGWRI